MAVGTNGIDTGCTSECKIQQGYFCYEETIGGGSTCKTICGDNFVV